MNRPPKRLSRSTVPINFDHRILRIPPLSFPREHHAPQLGGWQVFSLSLSLSLVKPPKGKLRPWAHSIGSKRAPLRSASRFLPGSERKPRLESAPSEKRSDRSLLGVCPSKSSRKTPPLETSWHFPGWARIAWQSALSLAQFEEFSFVRLSSAVALGIGSPLKRKALQGSQKAQPFSQDNGGLSLLLAHPRSPANPAGRRKRKVPTPKRGFSGKASSGLQLLH
jgi:hypothetical protein